MLELNVCNRNVRESRVCEYANEMSAGRWRLTGQGIIILEDGTVGDGQHRLYAIVKSGATVQMPVARGAKKNQWLSLTLAQKGQPLITCTYIMALKTPRVFVDQ